MINNNEPIVHAEWKFLEDLHHDRPVLWYMVAILFAAVLFIIAVVTSNYLFAAIILMLVFIYFFISIYHPHDVKCIISEEGVHIGRKFYKFGEIRKFWIIYEPSDNVNTMYLHFKNSIKSNLAIPLFDQDPIQIRDIMLMYLEEDLDEEEEPFTDTIARILKL